jgi:16S rRNA (adenine1518-N6/adenine1519-N6)-dimethyltransferase
MPTKFGQNFLKDNTVLDKIIMTAELNVSDSVLEVGPGEGVLTERLIGQAKKVVVVEIDKNLVIKLRNRFENTKNLDIVNADILEINLPELLVQNNFVNSGYKIIANIPYYITSPIIRLFLETVYPPKEMLLMVQKEVAERICAKAGNLNILALSVQYYADAEVLFNVPRKAFFPTPEVDSAVIRITLNAKRIEKENTRKFFRIVRAGFSAKRKTLINNLSSSLQLEKTFVEEILKQSGISSKQRAQELDVEDWKKLSLKLE